LTVQGKGEEKRASLLPERQMSAREESVRGRLGREALGAVRVLSVSGKLQEGELGSAAQALARVPPATLGVA
jgi:hypothetical protein